MKSQAFAWMFPSNRDLLEEIARLYGYDRFPGTLPAWRGYGSFLASEAGERKIRDLLSNSGYSEITTYSFSEEETERRFRPNIDPVRFQNPLSEDATILRTSLVPGILKSLQWNLNRGILDLQFFELSKVYRKSGENRALILAACGALRLTPFMRVRTTLASLISRETFESILQCFGGHAELADVNTENSFPRTIIRADVDDSAILQIFGEIHPETLEDTKDPASSRSRRDEYRSSIVVVANFITSGADDSTIPCHPARFFVHSQQRDPICHRATDDCRCGIPELTRIEPFDRMEVGQFADTKYSLSLSVVYQSTDRTLTDTEVEGFDRRILDVLEQRLGAQLRK